MFVLFSRLLLAWRKMSSVFSISISNTVLFYEYRPGPLASLPRRFHFTTYVTVSWKSPELHSFLFFFANTVMSHHCISKNVNLECDSCRLTSSEKGSKKKKIVFQDLEERREATKTTSTLDLILCGKPWELSGQNNHDGLQRWRAGTADGLT